MNKLALPIFLFSSLFSLTVFADSNCGSLLTMDETSFTAMAQKMPGLAPALDACVSANYCATSADTQCLSKLTYYSSIADFYLQKSIQTPATGGGITGGSQQTGGNPQPQYSSSNPVNNSPQASNPDSGNQTPNPPASSSTDNTANSSQKDIYNNIHF
jgi:hypothetical protein